ncbi:MAG: hypothetical protein ACOYEA_07910 [Fermentimonas sp.]|jgi:uncharacterized protein YpmB
MIQTLIIGIVVLVIAILLMQVKVLSTKNGEFSNTHIGANKAMQERGIGCATSQDIEYYKKESPVKKLLKN